MRTKYFKGLIIVIGLALIPFCSDVKPPPGEQYQQVLDTYIKAFSARDRNALLGVHHASCFYVDPEGMVEVYDRDNPLNPVFLSEYIKNIAWSRACWEGQKVVERSDDKVHLMARLALCDNRGVKLASYDGIYVLLWHEGRWGICGYSLFRPEVDEKKVLMARSEYFMYKRPGQMKAILKILDDYLQSFNAHDREGHLDTHHFPHFRLSEKKLSLYNRDNHYVTIPLFFCLFKALSGFKWHHSKWDHLKAVQASDKKVHMITRISRLTSDNEIYNSSDSLYIMSIQDGKWGIRGRSSFASF
jgi:hypothetical protein